MDWPLVRIVWLDASDPEKPTSWYTEEEIDSFGGKDCKVVSVGWVKSRTKKYVTLVADYILNDDNVTWTLGRPTKVPVSMIQIEESLVPESTAPSA